MAARADYVLAVKGSQRTLHEGIKAFLDRAIVHGFDKLKIKVRRHETRGHAHGRNETRMHYVCDAPTDLPDRVRWAKLTAIGMTINQTTRHGKQAVEVRYDHLEQKADRPPLRRRRH